VRPAVATLGEWIGPRGGGGGGEGPPEGFAWVIAAPGDYVVDGNGDRIIVESIDMADVLLAAALEALTGAIVVGGDSFAIDGTFNGLGSKLAALEGSIVIGGDDLTTPALFPDSLDIMGVFTVDASGDVVGSGGMNFQGGTFIIDAATGNITLASSEINVSGMQSSDGTTGTLWNDAGTVKVSA